MNVRRGAAVGAFVALGAAMAAVMVSRFSRGDAGLREALAGRGRIAVWDGAVTPGTPTTGSELVDAASSGPVAAALRGAESAALARALHAERFGAVLVRSAQGPADASGPLHARMARYARVPGLRALYLAPEAALYAPDPAHELGDVDREALAGVARGILGGAEPPRVASFPERLRRVAPVEVMVLLRRDGRPRLWRSARGSSMARALVTASVVARKRWTEREQAMGGPIDEVLEGIEVEVALLADDGTIGSPEEAFVDRVVGPEHGVAYERKGAWRYLLPEATHEHARPFEAYGALLAEEGLEVDALASPEVRPYRLVVEVLARSPAARGPVRQPRARARRRRRAVRPRRASPP